MSRFSARDLTLTAMFTALAVVAAVLARYAGPVVPFSLMPFVVMLAGGLLGPRLGALSMVVYLLLGLFVFPVFASPPYGGPAYVFTPTFGFLLGFIASAWVIGYLLGNPEKQSLVRYLLAMLAGILVYTAVGLPYLYVILNLYLGDAQPVGSILRGYIFIFALDLLKGVAAALLARAVARRLKAYGA